jgi:transcription elongation factor B subunit 1
MFGGDIPQMQSTVKAAIASARAQSSMDPVKIIAADGSEYILDRKVAMVSGAIKAMLSGPGEFVEGQQGEVKFPDIAPHILEKTIQYFYYKLKHTNHQGPLPEFKIEPEHACAAHPHARCRAQPAAPRGRRQHRTRYSHGVHTNPSSLRLVGSSC